MRPQHAFSALGASINNGGAFRRRRAPSSQLALRAGLDCAPATTARLDLEAEHAAATGDYPLIVRGSRTAAGVLGTALATAPLAKCQVTIRAHAVGVASVTATLSLLVTAQ